MLALIAEKPVQEGFGLDDIPNFFNNLPGEITGPIMEPIDFIIGFVNKINDFFSSIPRRIQDVNTGFEDIGKALMGELNALGTSWDTGIDGIKGIASIIPNDVGPYLNDFFTKYLNSIIMCGVHKVENLTYCFFYYILEVIGQALYTLMVRLPVFLLQMITGFDMIPYVNMGWKGIDALDSFIHGAVGFYPFRWSDTVMDKCFECRGLLPMPQFNMADANAKVDAIKTDFNVTIPRLMSEPVHIFADAGSSFQAAFN